MLLFRQNQSFLNHRQNSFFEMLKKKASYIIKALERIEIDLLKKNRTEKTRSKVQFLNQLRAMVVMNQILVNQIKNDFQMSDIQLMGQAIEKLFNQQTNIIYHLIKMNLKKEQSQVKKQYQSEQIQQNQTNKQKCKDEINQFRKIQLQKYELSEIIKYQTANKNKNQQNIWKLLNKNIEHEVFICNNFQQSKLSQVIAQTHNILVGAQYYNKKFIKNIQNKINSSQHNNSEANLRQIYNNREINVQSLQQFVKKLINKLKQLPISSTKLSYSTQTQKQNQTHQTNEKDEKKLKEIAQLKDKNKELTDYIWLIEKQLMNYKQLLKRCNFSKQNIQQSDLNLNLSLIQKDKIQKQILQYSFIDEKQEIFNQNSSNHKIYENIKLRNQKTDWKTLINKRIKKTINKYKNEESSFSRIIRKQSLINLKPTKNLKCEQTATLIKDQQFHKQEKGAKFIKLQLDNKKQRQSKEQGQTAQKIKLKQQKKIEQQNFSFFQKTRNSIVNKIRPKSQIMGQGECQIIKSYSKLKRTVTNNSSKAIGIQNIKNKLQNYKQKCLIISNIYNMTIEKCKNAQQIKIELREKENSKFKADLTLKKVVKKSLFESTYKKTNNHVQKSVFQPLNMDEKQLGLKILLKNVMRK